MSQGPGEKSQAATERAEAAFDQLGQRIGVFAHRIRQNVGSMAASVKNKVNNLEPPGTLSARKSSQMQPQQSGPPQIERAEEKVDHLGQRLGAWGSQTSSQFQKVVARVREDTEDMWVEAQNIRRQNHRLPH
jgi:hypothetical protein